MDLSNQSAERREQADFSQLFTEHAPFAWRVLRRFGVAESDLPDACQDAFLVVHRKLHEFEGRSQLRTWLYRICARVASDYRKRAHRRYETEPLTIEPSTLGDQTRVTELSQICAVVEHALDGLDDEKRQVFVLYELEDMTMTEIAALMACPLKTAFSRLYVARDRVNAALKRAGCAALVVALDPSPLRQTAHAQLVAALKATGGAGPSAAQLGAVHVGTLAATTAAASAFSAPLLFSGGALAVAAALALSLTNVTSSVSDTSQPAPQAPQVHASVAVTQVAPRVAKAVSKEADVASPVITATSRPAQRPRKRTPVSAPVVQTSATPEPAPVAAIPTEWIEAPPSATTPSLVAAEAVGTGLDEVLSATSIRSLMRVGPQSSRQQWALLPASPTESRAP